MTNAVDDPTVVIDQLVAKYPQTPRRDIETVVQRHWRHYAQARIRSFVPILVTRQAAKELKGS